MRLLQHWTSFLDHVQKTCSVPNRLGCRRHIADGRNGWESPGIHLTKCTFLDPTKHNILGATENNPTNSRPNNNSRYTHNTNKCRANTGQIGNNTNSIRTGLTHNKTNTETTLDEKHPNNNNGHTHMSIPTRKTRLSRQTNRR